MIIVTNIYDCDPIEVYDIITVTDYICGEKSLTKVDFLVASNCFTIYPWSMQFYIVKSHLKLTDASFVIDYKVMIWFKSGRGH